MGRIKSILIQLRYVSRRFRVLLWIIGILAVILMGASAYLRVYGIPDPLLRIVIRRANDAGIPVDVGRVKLTLRGWRADDVRYFSVNPADTKPIFKADAVYLMRYPFTNTEGSEEWRFNIAALGVEIGPSVEWGVELPEHSKLLTIESIKLSLEFLPDRIVLSNGMMHWLGSQFSVNGTVVKATAETIARRESESADVPKKGKQKTVSPVFVSKEMFQSLERRFNAIKVDGTPTIDIAFHIDANDYSATALNVNVNAYAITVQGVSLSRAAISASYCYPNMRLDHMALYRDGKSAQGSGAYDLSSRMLEGKITSTLTSNQLIKGLPTRFHELPDKLDIQFGQLPAFALDIGPCKAADVLNHISGTFSVQDFTYSGSTIGYLGGKLERKNDRLELSELSGTMLGLEHRAEETGSGMLGGTASGSVYFDSQTYWLGVDVDMNLDPSLLIGPLSTVRIATNVLHRFKFNGEEPPRGHIELGSCVTNWSTFFIDIQLTANEMTVHEADFTSVDLSASYSNKVLSIEPLTAFQGTNDLVGMVSIHFGTSTADFDLLTSMQPQTLQNAAYPALGVFGKSVTTSGKMTIEASGRIEWKTMKATDFKVEMAAGQIGLPVASLTGFTGTVIGDGPRLSVTNTQFTLYEGNGVGDFTIDLDPENEGMPYSVDLEFDQVNFHHFLQFFKPHSELNVSGLFAGTVLLQADIKRNFFESASGRASLAVTAGQLADLPFFNGLASLLRQVLPSINIFSFTGVNGDFVLGEGVVKTENLNLVGELISARARGLYSQKDGFDARIQLQTFSDRSISQLVRIVTDPILGLFEIKLEGTISDPSWSF